MRKDLKFQFVRNIPLDIANEAQAAATMNGIVSRETQLSTLSFVDDPKAEMNRMNEEQQEQVKQALQNSTSAPDMLRGDNNGNTEPEVLAGSSQSREAMDGAKPRQR